MTARLYAPIFTCTLMLSAALLFVVQPMFAKMILPLLGGAPQVWNTSMLFFQTALLAGYAYAHISSYYLSVKHQGFVHIALIALFFIVLPLGISEDMTPTGTENPTIWQLTTMLLTVGGPFFCLSAIAPMLQRWFAHTDHKDAHNPYFLYAASNIGSVLALISYPFLIEPAANLDDQGFFWSIGYGALLICIVLITVIMTAGKVAGPALRKEIGKNVASDTAPSAPSWRDRGLWLFFAFVPSSLMLSVTTFVTVDVASVPLIWIIPLTLYILTFVVAFARNPIISQVQSRWLTTASILAFIGITFMKAISHYDVFLLIPFHFAMFFFIALSFHHNLVARAPAAKHLTEFYLIMSLGGALGGLFNAIIAPYAFTMTIEHSLIFVLAAALHFASDRTDLTKFKVTKRQFIYFLAALFIWQLCHLLGVFNLLTLLLIVAINHTIYRNYKTMAAIFIGIFLIIESGPYQELYRKNMDYVQIDRSYFGVLRVADQSYIRSLHHGTTRHGLQIRIPGQELTPTTYFNPYSGLAEVFSWYDSKDPAPQQIAALGLGVGTVLCYPKENRHFDIYEIDPHVVEVAENPELFTFMRDCGSPYSIVLGDGRLGIQKAKDHKYDMILVDVFSSDNIPVHMMTKEAFALYLSKLKDGGALVVHISNRHLNLEPVIHNIAKSIGAYSLIKTTPHVFQKNIGEHGIMHQMNIYAVVTKDDVLYSHLKNKQITLQDARGGEVPTWQDTTPKDNVGLWTDKYSDIVSVIKGLEYFLNDNSEDGDITTGNTSRGQ